MENAETCTCLYFYCSFHFKSYFTVQPGEFVTLFLKGENKDFLGSCGPQVKVIFICGPHTAQFDLKWAGPVKLLHNNPLKMTSKFCFFLETCTLRELTFSNLFIKQKSSLRCLKGKKREY